MRCASMLIGGILVAIVSALALATPVQAATFLVTDNDDGEDLHPGDGVCATRQSFGVPYSCTLRAAITEANHTPALDEIVFGDGSGTPRPVRLTLSSPLPTITAPVLVDGATRAGYNGVPLIELDGANVSSSFGLHVTGGGSTIRGLAILHFGTGIMLSGGGGNVVEGNYIGITTGGAYGSNRWGLQIAGSPDNRIGGPTPRQRNVISGNGYQGIKISGAASRNTRIVGNYVGMDPSGRQAIGNRMDGIYVNNAGPTIIGGPQRADGNLISGNRGNGVIVGGQAAGADGHLIANNLIGWSLDLWPRARNGGDGLAVFETSNVTVGGGHGQGNLIAWNAGAGVSARKSLWGTYGENIRISGNTVMGNGGLDIDLANRMEPDGVTPNDLRDADSGPNGLQNAPVLTSATVQGGTTRISATLQSEPNREFEIDFSIGSECARSGHGVLWPPAPAPHLSSVRVKTDSTGSVSFAFEQSGIPVDSFVVATASKLADQGTRRSTSEFSECRQVTAPEPTPTPTATPSATPTMTPTPTSTTTTTPTPTASSTATPTPTPGSKKPTTPSPTPAQIVTPPPKP